MVRLATVAGILGLLTGLWTLAAAFLDGVMHTCPAGGCPPSGYTPYGVAIIVLGVALVFNSAVSFFWHHRVLYVSSLLSALLAAVVVFDVGSIDPPVFWVTIVLAVLSAVVNLLAARVKTTVSEQSHPMNLPVFG